MNKKTAIITSIIATIIVATGIAAYLTPLPASPLLNPESAQIYFAVPLTYTLFHLETAVLFIIGLKRFKSRLRRAYIILCIAIFLLALAQIQLPVASLLNAQSWINNGFFALPYMAASFLLFAGIRSFACALDIRSRYTSYWLAVLTALAFMALSMLAPAKLSMSLPTAPAFHVAIMLTIWELVMQILAIVNMRRIVKVMSPAYGAAMQALLQAISVYTVVTFQYFALIWIDYDSWYAHSGLHTVPFLVSGILFIRAGYLFWAIGTRENAGKPGTILDAVMATAQLATNPRHIHTIMDKVRLISSRLQVGQPLSPSDERELGLVYLALEDYLLKREPLRKVSREELRQQVEGLVPLQQPANAAFWEVLKADA